MAEYTPKQKKQLEKNKYTYKVTDKCVFFTAEFKKEFRARRQNGERTRDIMKALGYDPSLFTESQLDNLNCRIRKQGLAGVFTEGNGAGSQIKAKTECPEMTEEAMRSLWVQVQYLSQEVEFVKKLLRAGGSA